jgi:hypothetical protein
MTDRQRGEVLREYEFVWWESTREGQEEGELEAAKGTEPLVCAAAAAGELEGGEGEEGGW